MEAETSSVHVVEELPVGTDVIQSRQEIDIAENDYVAAIYQKKVVYWKGFFPPTNPTEPQKYLSWFKVSSSSSDPERSDVIWLDVNDVLCIIDPPTATGKSNWMFKMDEASKQKAEILFAVWQGKNNDIN